MSFVMVPVPEDRVADVMQYVVRLMAQAAMEEWDGESVSELFASIDEPSRALLSAVAVSVLDGDPPSLENVAAQIEMSVRETMGILREVNELARDDSHPPVLVPRSAKETLPNGRERTVRQVFMDNDVAQMIYECDRALLLAEGDPLGGSDG